MADFDESNQSSPTIASTSPVHDDSVPEQRQPLRPLFRKTIGPTIVSTVGLSALAVMGIWLHPTDALSQNRTLARDDGAPAKITRTVQDPFEQPPRKFDLPAPPAFAARKKPESTIETPVAIQKPIEPKIVERKPAPVVVPPPPAFVMPKVQIVAKPKVAAPLVSAPPPKLDLSPAPAPASTLTAMVMPKRTCSPRERFELVSRDFSTQKPQVFLDPSLRAEAPRIRRLEIQDDAPAPPIRPVVQTVAAAPAMMAPVPASIPMPTIRPDRIELRAVPLLRKVGSPVLLVARALDAVGQPLPQVMIEWSVDRRGVGHVVTIPEMFRTTTEPNTSTEKAEKVLPTFARTPTSGKAYRMETANSDGMPIEIQPGEACCFVNSNLAGDMSVVAIAPSIARSDRREVSLKLHWSNARADFPKSIRVATGSDIALATHVVGGDDGKPLPGYSVRYRVTDREKTGRTNESVDEIATDSEGKAILKRNRPVRDSGVERVEIQLLGANTLQGNDAVILAKGECQVDWFDPKLDLKVESPAIARVGDWQPIVVRLENRDVVPLNAIQIVPECRPGIEIGTSNAYASVRPTRDIESFRAGQTDEWQTAVRAREPGREVIRFVVRDSRGVRCVGETKVEFAAPKLSISKPPAVSLAVGQKHEQVLVVRNDGAVVAKAVEVEDDLPADVAAEVVDGLRLMDRMLWRVGDLKPGENRKLLARWTARKPVDSVALRARATESGATCCDCYSKLSVRGCPALSVEIVDSADPVEIGKPFTLTVRLRNRGTAAAENVSLVGVLPAQFSFSGSSGALAARFADGRIRFDSVVRVEPGESIEGTLHVKALKAGEARTSIRLFHEAVGPDGIETQESTSVFGIDS